jgi:hypothetical protein
MNDLHADTKIVVFKQLEFKELVENDGMAYGPEFEEVLLRKERKIEIMEAEAKAMANGIFPPFIILIPLSYLEPPPTTLTYPLPFFESQMYFIEEISEVICLESK